MAKIKWTKEMFLKGVSDAMNTMPVQPASGSMDNLSNQEVIDRIMALRKQAPPTTIEE